MQLTVICLKDKVRKLNFDGKLLLIEISIGKKSTAVSGCTPTLGFIHCLSKENVFSMSSYHEASGSGMVAADHRRKWDRDEFEQKARERLLAEKEAEERIKRKPLRFPDEPKVKRELLKAREYKVAWKFFFCVHSNILDCLS